MVNYGVVKVSFGLWFKLQGVNSMQQQCIERHSATLMAKVAKAWVIARTATRHDQSCSGINFQRLSCNNGSRSMRFRFGDLVNTLKIIVPENPNKVAADRGTVWQSHYLVT